MLASLKWEFTVNIGYCELGKVVHTVTEADFCWSMVQKFGLKNDTNAWPCPGCCVATCSRNSVTVSPPLPPPPTIARPIAASCDAHSTVLSQNGSRQTDKIQYDNVIQRRRENLKREENKMILQKCLLCIHFLLRFSCYLYT